MSDKQHLDEYIQTTYHDLMKVHELATEDYESAKAIVLINDNDIEEVKTLSTITSDKLKIILETIKQRTELLKVVERIEKSLKPEKEENNSNGLLPQHEMDAIQDLFKMTEAQKVLQLRD